MQYSEESTISSIKHFLEKDYQGIDLAVCAIAATGLAVSIHRKRPFSKYSKASRIPTKFLSDHTEMTGVCAGVNPSPVRVLVNHRPPIYLPFWHSSKPPLPVKLWGVDIVSGNAFSWLQCMAQNQKVTLKPISRDNDDLVSSVVLHLPNPKAKKIEELDLAQKLVELGFATANVTDLKALDKKSPEYQLLPKLLKAEKKAKYLRNGIWSDFLPPVPIYAVYWRKSVHYAGSLLILLLRNIEIIIIRLLKGALVGTKNLALRPFRKPISM